MATVSATSASFSAVASTPSASRAPGASPVEHVWMARMRQASLAVWTYFEAVGAVRAAAELERRARTWDVIDPARAQVLHDAARRCLARV